MYLAAIVHDYGHKGVNNEFLVRVQDPLAVRDTGSTFELCCAGAQRVFLVQVQDYLTAVADIS